MQKINNLAISFEDAVKSELWGLNEMTNKLDLNHEICHINSLINYRNKFLKNGFDCNQSF